MSRLSERRFFVLLYVTVFVVGLFLSWPSLSYDWFSDDLQLVRTYSNQELIEGFTGDYDPTGGGSAGWRPLTRVYYHAESLLFGNTVQLHRLFNIAMFTLHVTLLMLIARRLGLSRLMVLVAGLIFVCSKNTWWMLVWPTDGLRNFMGIMGSLAIYFLIDHLAKPARWKFALSIIFYALALLTREEIVFYVAAIPAIGFLFLLQKEGIITQPRRWLRVSGLRTVLIYTLVNGVLTAAFWVTRARLVPRIGSLPVNPEGWVFNLIAVLFPHLPAPSIVASAALIGLFWLVLIFMLWGIGREKRLMAFFWLGCVVVATSPGLSSWRANNLLLPIGFFTLFLVTILVSFARRSRLAACFCALLLAGFIGGSAAMHQLAQETIHPYSLYYITATRLYMWGAFADVYVPQDRRDRLWAEYRALGIDTPEKFDAVYPQLVADALNAGRLHPDGDKPFSPVYPNYLQPW